MTIFIKSRQFCKNSNKGFTLVELIIYLAIVGTVLVFTTYFAIDIIHGRVKANVLQEVHQNFRFAMGKMTQEIRRAKDITSLSSSTLVLDNDGVAEAVTFNFDAVNKKVTMQIGSGSITDLTGDEVEVIGSFTNLSYAYPTGSNRSKNVKIDMTVSYKNPENMEEWEASQTVETTVELRGK